MAWFIGKDVAAMLGYSNTRKALIDHVDEDDKMDGVTIRDSIGQEQKPVLSIRVFAARQLRHI
ncbi:MAG: BRO family protein [Bacteroidales bacterium]|nr:BRO family protein [Bacteroidales bacterium]